MKIYHSAGAFVTFLALAVAPVSWAAERQDQSKVEKSQGRISPDTQNFAKGLSSSLSKEGYSSKVGFSGQIESGKSVVIHLYFYAGAEYVAIASGNADASTFQVAVFGDDKSVVGSANGGTPKTVSGVTSDAPEVKFTAPYTGDYYIKVTLVKGKKSPTDYALTLGYKKNNT